MTTAVPRRAPAKPGGQTRDGTAIADAHALDVAFDALPIGVLLCTPSGDRANDELRRIVRIDGSRRFERRDLEGRVESLDPTVARRRGRSLAAKPIRAVLGGTAWAPGRMRLERADGTAGVVRVTACSVAFADGPGAVVTVADETAAHEADRLRDGFLGIVGHELRSPISSIFAAADLLRDDHLAADVRTEVAAELGDEAHRLHQLVDQLIRLADLGRADDLVSDEPAHLTHLVTTRIARWRQRQPRLVLELELPGGSPPPVAGDEGYIAQALDILLDNAVKYAGLGERIVIRIEQQEAEVRLHVLDRGPGLPDDAEPVFGLFRRGVRDRPARHPAPPGHGIGLFVARSIIEALHGRIWARNRLDGGADVGFALPIVADDN
jgi:signal transduction histidine kinase